MLSLTKEEPLSNALITLYQNILTLRISCYPLEVKSEHYQKILNIRLS